MIPFFALFIFLLAFVSGYLLTIDTAYAMWLLALASISAGCLTAYLQTERLPDDQDL